MQFNFFQGFFRQSLEVKIFSAIILLAILARIFVLFMLPDTALTDSMYHLTITKYIVQNYAIPFQGIPKAGVVDMPVPLFHFLTSGFFILFQIPVTLAVAKIFPVIFSFLQLLLSFILLKRMFPKNWIFGFAFVAIQPLLVIFGGVNYLETLASVTVLFCFFVYWRYLETGSKKFIVVMPFALMLLAISKESATILVPVFFVFFLYALLKKMPSRDFKSISPAVCFVVAAILLFSAWFVISFAATGGVSSAIDSGVTELFVTSTVSATFESIFLYPLNFNAGFWFFLPQGFESLPFGISSSMVFAVFTLISFPFLMLLFYGLVKGLGNRRSSLFMSFVLLAVCFAISLVPVISRGRMFVQGRMILPVMPLLGIAFSNAFKELKFPWKKFFTLLFLLLALYAVVFSCFYALHFNQDYNNHVPLYEFVKDLPDESKIVIHGNKTRQIEFIAGKEAISPTTFMRLESEQLYLKLNESGITHLAETCYKNPWNKDVLEELESQGKLVKVFSDGCSNLYGVNR